MRAKDIPAYEADFDKNLMDTDGIRFTAKVDSAFPFPHTMLVPMGRSGFYKMENVTKNLIIIHRTDGFLKGDISALTEQDYLVSVPFVIGRNGTVYQLFSSSFWSYHLGKGCAGGNLINSQRSIAIEVSNIGPLTLSGGTLINAYGDPYCDLSETQYYMVSPYRGYQYYATFTDAQYVSLKALINFLCNKFNIPKVLLPEPARYNLFDYATAGTYKGIASHVNYRPDKTDIGPAFKWDI